MTAFALIWIVLPSEQVARIPVINLKTAAFVIQHEVKVLDISQVCFVIGNRNELSSREIEIFILLAQGRSLPYIRDVLFISNNTASTHAKSIYRKLGVHTRQELIDLVHSHKSG
jgi:DNA-binding NarL/FixJ family response regulator